MIKLIISKEHMKELMLFSKSNLPDECSVFLFGKIDKDDFDVKMIHLNEAESKSPAHFIMADEDILSAYNRALEVNMDVIGIFHSHPNHIPHPSETDLVYMEKNKVVWLIYSIIKNQAQAWFLEDSNLKQVLISMRN